MVRGVGGCRSPANTISGAEQIFAANMLTVSISSAAAVGTLDICWTSYPVTGERQPLVHPRLSKVAVHRVALQQ